MRRGISRATLDAAGVMQERRFIKQLGRIDDVIAFVYKRRGQIVNVKYRTVDKRFSQASAICGRGFPLVEPALLLAIPASS